MTRWLTSALARLPWPVVRLVAAALGDLWFLVIPIRRRVALDNLAASGLDPGSTRGRLSLIRHTCRHLVLNVLELPRGVDPPGGPGDAGGLRIRVEGVEHLRRAHAAGRGVVVATAHLGNWELLGPAARRLGLPTTMVVRPLGGPRSRRWITELRRRAGVEVIEEGPGLAVRMLRSLARGDVLGLAIDQRPHDRGRKPRAAFLGRRTALCSTAAVLSVRTGAPLLVALAHREPDGGHVIRLSAPLDPGGRERPVRQRVDDLARACHRRVERAIADNPEQWLWHHRRWARRGATT